VKVCDFGVAKTLRDGAGLTVGGALVGTPAYMSPEQARGAPPEPRSDIYALGIVLYEMTTGRLPFTADVLVAILMMHIADPPPPLDASFDPRLAALIMRMLAKDPNARPASARELRENLRALQSQ
jgi:serine/threonine protein kinase